MSRPGHCCYDPRAMGTNASRRAGTRAAASRWLTARGGPARAAVLCCAAVVALAGCGSQRSAPTPKYLDVVKVEHAIEHSIMQQRHLHSTVVCPPHVQQTPHKFACIATTPSRKNPHKTVQTPFLVTIHNDKGFVSYIGE